VDDHLAAVVLLAPGEVVVVLDAGERRRPQRRRHPAVDDRVVRRGVLAHQLHLRPILLARLRTEIEPRQVPEPLRQLRVRRRRELRGVVGHLGAGAAAAGVAEQRDVGPGGQASGRSRVSVPSSAKWFPDPDEPSCDAASTPPIGRPQPGWASGMSAPRTDTGSRAASRI
jgi:hypothetical protein